MKIIRVLSFGLGAFSLAESDVQAQDRNDETTNLIVRIDDRRSHDLTQPWVSLSYPDGTMLDAIALDDGSDSEDAIPSDHLYVCRMNVQPGENVEVWILDSGPIMSGELVYETTVDLTEGRTHRVTMRAGGASPGRATSVETPSLTQETDETDSTNPEEEIEASDPEPGIDSSLGFAHEASVVPIIPEIRRWKTRDVWGLVGLFFLGLVTRHTMRNTKRMVIRRVDSMTKLIDKLHAHPSALDRPKDSMDS